MLPPLQEADTLTRKGAVSHSVLVSCQTLVLGQHSHPPSQAQNLSHRNPKTSGTPMAH